MRSADVLKRASGNASNFGRASIATQLTFLNQKPKTKTQPQ
jgi:hypothetical protein